MFQLELPMQLALLDGATQGLPRHDCKCLALHAYIAPLVMFD